MFVTWQQILLFVSDVSPLTREENNSDPVFRQIHWPNNKQNQIGNLYIDWKNGAAPVCYLTTKTSGKEATEILNCRAALSAPLPRFDSGSEEAWFGSAPVLLARHALPGLPGCSQSLQGAALSCPQHSFVFTYTPIYYHTKRHFGIHNCWLSRLQRLPWCRFCGKAPFVAQNPSFVNLIFLLKMWIWHFLGVPIPIHDLVLGGRGGNIKQGQ